MTRPPNIPAWYYWLYHDVCGLPQPFTYYFRKSATGPGILAWLFAALFAGLGLAQLREVKAVKWYHILAGGLGGLVLGLVLGHFFWS